MQNSTPVTPRRNPFDESLGRIRELLLDPGFMSLADLSPAWIVAETTGVIGGKPATGGNALADVLRGLESKAAVDLELETPTFAYRPDGPVYHVRTAIHGEVDADLVRLIRANDESTVGVRERENPHPPNPYRRLVIAGAGDTFDAIPRRGNYACPNIGRDKARVVVSVRGGSYRIDLPCEDKDGDCDPCRQHWIDSAVARFRRGLIGDTQLVITTTAHQTPQEAQKLVSAIGRQLGPVRRSQVLSRTRDYTYAAHIVVTGSMLLPSTLASIAARPGVAVEYRAVSDDDLKALLHSRSKVDGKRCPVRFLHWPTAIPADAATTTYAHNDGHIAAAMDARTIPEIVYTRRRSLKIPESVRVRLREFEASANADIWLTGIALNQMALLKLAADRRDGKRHKDDWQDCIASGTYDGPKALIRDLAAALDDDGMVSFMGRACMRVAATHIGGE